MIDIDFLYDGSGSSSQVRCPSCGDGLIHPIKVVVNRGGEITTVTDQGTAITKGKAAGRGVLIASYFACECGTVFVTCHHFHEGATKVGTKILGNFASGDSPETEDMPHFRTIWRD